MKQPSWKVRPKMKLRGRQAYLAKQVTEHVTVMRARASVNPDGSYEFVVTSDAGPDIYMLKYTIRTDGLGRSVKK